MCTMYKDVALCQGLKILNSMVVCTPVIPDRLRQEDWSKFKASLGHIANITLTKQQEHISSRTKITPKPLNVTKYSPSGYFSPNIIKHENQRWRDGTVLNSAEYPIRGLVFESTAPMSVHKHQL